MLADGSLVFGMFKPQSVALTVLILSVGSMTDPPALQFATSMTGTESPSIAYAAVYPLVIVLRVIAAQVLVLIFA